MFTVFYYGEKAKKLGLQEQFNLIQFKYWNKRESYVEGFFRPSYIKQLLLDDILKDKYQNNYRDKRGSVHITHLSLRSLFSDMSLHWIMRIEI